MAQQPKSFDIKPEMFKKQVKLPPVFRPQPSKFQGVRGTLPLKPGELILSPAEEERLRSEGWKPGMALPGNIAERVALEKQQVQHEIETMRPPQNRPPLQLSEPIDIEQLSPEKQAQVRSYIEGFQQVAPQMEQAFREDKDFGQLTPAAQKAVQETGVGFNVVDSRRQSMTDLQRRIDEAEGKVGNREDDKYGLAEDEEPEKPAEATGEVCQCRRCGWDVKQGCDEPTETDVVGYAAAVLGMKLFTRQYELMAGKIKLTFQQLPTSLSESIVSQIKKELRTGLLEQDESVQMAMLYRMLLALEVLEINGEKFRIADTVKGLIEADGDMHNMSNIVEACKNQEPLNNEAVWQMCRNTHERFYDLVETLILRAERPGFWVAIES